MHEQFQYARESCDLVVLEGFHAWKHAVRFGANILEVVTDDSQSLAVLADALAPDLRERVDTIPEVSKETFRTLSPTPPESHLIALADRRHVSFAEIERREGVIVVLDHPTHPGNVGACIRVAAARGVAGVIVVGEIDPWHPSVVRGAAGLQFAVPVMQLDELPNTSRSLIAFHEEGIPLPNASIPNNALLIFGSERRGISKELRSRAAHTICIPMQPGVSSLNLATSVAIVLYT